MAALCNRAGHIYFHPVVSSFFLSSFFPRLISAVGDWMSTRRCGLSVNLECARGSLKIQHAKNCQKVAIWAPSQNFVRLYLRNNKVCIDNRKKNLVKQQCLLHNPHVICPHNMVNFGPLAAEICWRVWGTLANFNGFRVLTALLHGIPVLGVSQTLRRWTEGAAYIRQGDHHVGHWPHSS